MTERLLLTRLFAVRGPVTQIDPNMASIARSDSQLAIISGGCVAVYDIGSSPRQVYKCEKPAPASDKQPGSTESGSDRILTCGFSPRGTFFAACDDYKQITLWKTGGTWTKVSTRPVVRRGTSLIFTKTEDVVLLADKSGDVFSFSTSQPEEGGKLLLGHVSMLLDVVLLADDRFIATCDRDEKVRISCYPNTHTIHAFCLGHTDFVSSLAYFEEAEVLVSGSGDGTVRLWNYNTGEQLSVTNCREILGFKADGTRKVCDEKSGEQEGNGQSESVSQVQSNSEDTSVNVSCLACLQHRRLLVTAFEGLSEVLVWRLETKHSGSHCLALTQRLSLSSSPWALSLDPQGTLWTLTPCQGSPLQVFHLQEPQNQEFIPLEGSDEAEGLMTTVRSVNQDWEFFKDSLSAENPYNILRKARIDNMTEYIERKKERLKGQKLTQGPTRATEKNATSYLPGEPDSKKLKTS